MTYTHQTAPTQFVETSGIRFAYRRFGKTAGVPIVMNIHFRGTMDHWDPMITDGLAERREVILFDNAGVGRSSGDVPTTIAGMEKHVFSFVDALGIKVCDVLGYSLGGMVAQQEQRAAAGNRFERGIGHGAVIFEWTAPLNKRTR